MHDCVNGSEPSVILLYGSATKICKAHASSAAKEKTSAKLERVGPPLQEDELRQPKNKEEDFEILDGVVLFRGTARGSRSPHPPPEHVERKDTSGWRP